MVVGVVAPPGAHPERGVQAKRFLRTPERVEAADRFGVLAPVGVPPLRALGADFSGVGVARLLAN